jgi:hypothetical protein
MNIALCASALGFACAISASAFAADPGLDPDHDHRHGARTTAQESRPQPAHMTLVQVASYIAAQVPGDLRKVQAHPGSSLYRVDVDLINGTVACFEVDAHDGAVSWRHMPATRD